MFDNRFFLHPLCLYVSLSHSPSLCWVWCSNFFHHVTLCSVCEFSFHYWKWLRINASLPFNGRHENMMSVSRVSLFLLSRPFRLIPMAMTKRQHHFFNVYCMIFDSSWMPEQKKNPTVRLWIKCLEMLGDTNRQERFMEHKISQHFCVYNESKCGYMQSPYTFS